MMFFRNHNRNLDELTDEDKEKAKKEAWHYRINPCDWAAYEVIKRLRPLINIASTGTDCLCCVSARVIAALFAGLALGANFGAVLFYVLLALYVVWALVMLIAYEEVIKIPQRINDLISKKLGD